MSDYAALSPVIPGASRSRKFEGCLEILPGRDEAVSTVRRCDSAYSTGMLSLEPSSLQALFFLSYYRYSYCLSQVRVRAINSP